jgi:hypothetical protein
MVTNVKQASIIDSWIGNFKGFTWGPKSQVPIHLRCISAIENMEVGTYHFTRGSKS